LHSQQPFNRPLQAFLLSSVAQRGGNEPLPAALSPLLSDGPIALLVLAGAQSSARRHGPDPAGRRRHSSDLPGMGRLPAMETTARNRVLNRCTPEHKTGSGRRAHCPASPRLSSHKHVTRNSASLHTCDRHEPLLRYLGRNLITGDRRVRLVQVFAPHVHLKYLTL